MEAGRARGYRDNPRLPTLSLGLSSVRLIVNKIEAEYARADTSENGRELVKYDPNIDEGYDDYYDSPLDESSGRVWSRFAVNLGKALSLCIPSVSFANFGVLAVVAGFFAPRMISYLVLYPFCRLVFGTLYPAYASYKAVRTKNLKEYVKWMMYWIVFALFTCTETFTDVFLSWFPFYYEVKIVLVLWLLSPATKGSSILYRKFVHPALCRREQEIDEYIAKAKDQGYHTVLNLGTKGVNYATTVIMQTAIKGGGGLVQQIRKSYSLSDLSECEPREERGSDEADDVMTEPRLIRRVAKNVYNTRRSASESNSRSPMYFPEVDVDVRNTRPNRTVEPDFSHIKSSEDISSGYSSADNSASLTRTASMGASARVKARTTRTTVTTIKRPQAAEDNEVIIEELHDDDSLVYANMPALVNLPPSLYLSDTDPPFIYQYVGDQIKIIQVLGNNPLTTTFNNETNNPDQWDQKEATFEDASSIVETLDSEHNDSTYTSTVENVTKDEPYVSTKPINEHEPPDVSKNLPEVTVLKNHENTDVNTETKSKDNKQEEETNTVIIPKTDLKDNRIINFDITTVIEHKPDDKLVSDIKITKNEEAEIPKQDLIITDEPIDTTSLDTSLNENYSAESDDEASFGTPEDSPKSKRKSPKGKYGKGKAPPPPIVNTELSDNKKTAIDDKILDCAVSTTSQESLVDFVNKMPNTAFKETGFKGLQVVNPIAEKKRRHKSKSPGRIPKGNSSGIGKLLQLPSKLAFWKTPDDKPKDNISTSSGDRSRRSSTMERSVEEFQSCNELNNIGRASIDVNKKDEDQISFKDATDFDSEISHDIMEKSDALQKLIEAKLESHPEYKIVSLHEEIPTTSKSTDV